MKWIIHNHPLVQVTEGRREAAYVKEVECEVRKKPKEIQVTQMSSERPCFGNSGTVESWNDQARLFP